MQFDLIAATKKVRSLSRLLRGRVGWWRRRGRHCPIGESPHPALRHSRGFASASQRTATKGGLRLASAAIAPAPEMISCAHPRPSRESVAQQLPRGIMLFRQGGRLQRRLANVAPIAQACPFSKLISRTSARQNWQSGARSRQLRGLSTSSSRRIRQCPRSKANATSWGRRMRQRRAERQPRTR
jgi:hypothetical protein